MAKVEGSNPFIRFIESPGDPGLSCILARFGALVICVGYHVWVPNRCLCWPPAGTGLGVRTSHLQSESVHQTRSARGEDRIARDVDQTARMICPILRGRCRE
jgi:hypothetical protein